MPNMSLKGEYYCYGCCLWHKSAERPPVGKPRPRCAQALARQRKRIDDAKAAAPAKKQGEKQDEALVKAIIANRVARGARQ